MNTEMNKDHRLTPFLTFYLIYTPYFKHILGSHTGRTVPQGVSLWYHQNIYISIITIYKQLYIYIYIYDIQAAKIWRPTLKVISSTSRGGRKFVRGLTVVRIETNTSSFPKPHHTVLIMTCKACQIIRSFILDFFNFKSFDSIILIFYVIY